jgi:hypothetical protein
MASAGDLSGAEASWNAITVAMPRVVAILATYARPAHADSSPAAL